ncbi:MAG: RecX family transcriptional regulator [Chloroflexota bacterium]|jgi:regulatory protein
MERKITALKLQKRNPNRVNVYLDGEYAFSLSRIVAAWLGIGQSLSEEKVQTLQQEEVRETAYQRALLILSYRARSEHELRQKLSQKGFEAQVVNQVVVRLKSERYLGDAEFAQLWTDNRSQFRPRSQRLLRYELKQKGVSEEHIEKALETVEDESVLAYQAGARYARRLTGVEHELFRKRLTGFLARRGFSYGTIAPVITRIWSEMHLEESKKT